MFLVSSCSYLCAIHWCQVFSREWRCSWSSADRRCSNYICVMNNFIAYLGATYIIDLSVVGLSPIRYVTDTRTDYASGKYDEFNTLLISLREIHGKGRSLIQEMRILSAIGNIGSQKYPSWSAEVCVLKVFILKHHNFCLYVISVYGRWHVAVYQR